MQVPEMLGNHPRIVRHTHCLYHFRIKRDLTANSKLMMIHISCLVELDCRHDLFYLAHQLVDDFPKNPVSWYAVGCYYLHVKEFMEARRYFSKAGDLDPQFGAAWIGYGSSFAIEGEHDQAVIAYSTANKLMKGSHLPKLYIGMQYLILGNLPLAKTFLESARLICDADPALENELGAYWFKMADYKKAETFFLNACRLGKDSKMNEQQWVDTWINLGHVYRKLGYINFGSCFNALQALCRLKIILSQSSLASAGLCASVHLTWTNITRKR